jgi:hypothetical protein
VISLADESGIISPHKVDKQMRKLRKMKLNNGKYLGSWHGLV